MPWWKSFLDCWPLISWVSSLTKISNYLNILYVCNLEWKLMGRRKSLCLCFFILSASCIIAMLCKHFSGCIPDETDCGVAEIPQNCNSAMLNASKYLAFVGKFAVGSCFSILYTYSAELYPTCVRSSAVGFCSSMARVGGALSPLIFGIDATIPWFSNTVFGTLSFIGKISLLYWPLSVIF